MKSRALNVARVLLVVVLVVNMFLRPRRARQ